MSRQASWDLGTLGHSFATKSLDEALEKYDLNYTVGTTPVKGVCEDGFQIDLPRRKLTYRMDTKEPFGIVSDTYPIIQNRESLAFIENIIDTGDMTLLKGGQSKWGSIYLIGSFPETKVLDDQVKPHLIFQNSHDGSIPLKATICMLRLVCQNQFTSNFKSSPATIRIIHRGDTETKLKEASMTLKSVYEYVQAYTDCAETLSRKKVNSTLFDKIVEGYFKIPDEVSARVETRILRDREAFRNAYSSDDNSNHQGSMWGVVNAFTDYATHREMKNMEAHFYDTIDPAGQVSNFLEYVAAQ